MNNLKTYILNGQRIWQGNLNKIDGRYLHKPAGFVIRPLNRKDAAAMGELSTDIYRHLNPGEECFIHRHRQSYYNSVFDNPDIHYIGIFRGSRLIGMSNMTICRNPYEFAAEIPNCPINFFDRPETLAAAFGADCVRPEYRGNSLNRIMIACRLQVAAEIGCTDAASIVDRHNHWNMPPYFDNNFNMFAAGTDPADGGKIALLHHNLQQPPQKSVDSGICIPYHRFDIIDRLLAKGYAGRGYNRQSSGIIFTAAPEYRRSRQTAAMIVLRRTGGLSHV